VCPPAEIEREEGGASFSASHLSAGEQEKGLSQGGRRWEGRRNKEKVEKGQDKRGLEEEQVNALV